MIDPILIAFPRDRFWADGTPMVDRLGKPQGPKKLQKGNPNHGPDGRFASASGGGHVVSDKPIEPGSLPIKPGYIRAYHYTGRADPAAIRREGLKFSAALGSTYGEPNFVWGSTYKPDFSTPVVEFAVPAEDLSENVSKPRPGDDLDAWMKGEHHIGLTRDVRPDEILAVHEPWHEQYLYLNNPDDIARVMSGELDFLVQGNDKDPYDRAIRQIKAENAIQKSVSDMLAKRRARR